MRYKLAEIYTDYSVIVEEGLSDDNMLDSS